MILSKSACSAQKQTTCNPVWSVLVAVAIVFFMISSPLSAQAGDYGAIYYSNDGGGQLGSSWDLRSRRSARDEAKAACKEDGGKECERFVEFGTGQCGALAESPEGAAGAKGPNKNVARADALRNCEELGPSCKIVEVACNSGLDDGRDDDENEDDRANNDDDDQDDYEDDPLARQLQGELKRLGCLNGSVDGIWGNGSRSALRRFARQAGLRLSSEPTRKALREAQNTDRGYCNHFEGRFN